MLRDASLQAVFMGVLAPVVGIASSFAVVIQGLTAAGASADQAASGLTVLILAMGLCGMLLTLRTRMPITIAWSTPGAALLVGTDMLPGGFPEAVGAFLISGALVVAAGVIRPFGRAVAAIPAPLANAMLAGVLLGLCLAPFRAIAFDPLLGLPIVLAWVLVGRVNRMLATPAALIAFVLVVTIGLDLPADSLGRLSAAIPPPIEPVLPNVSLAGLAGLALPLFLVTMASQNIPGIAVLKVNGFAPAPGPLFSVTGLFSLAGAPFGAHSVNLAAITAAMCAGRDAHEDPSRRYVASLVAGGVNVCLALIAGTLTTFISFAPSVLIEAVAGLALIGAFTASAVAAFGEPADREAAAVTFLVTASGLTFYGISGAFWGLLAGGLVMGLRRLGRDRPDH